MIPKELLAGNLISQHGVQCVLKTFEETGQEEDKRRSVRPKKLSTADEQYLKVMSLKKEKKIHQRPNTMPQIGLDIPDICRDYIISQIFPDMIQCLKYD